MFKEGSDGVVVLLHGLVGGWLTPFLLVLLLGGVNFMFVHMKGIQFLDKEFSPEKRYDDTWTYAAAFRFFNYCREYLRGRIKTQKLGIHIWMCFNSATYVLTCLLLLARLLLECHKWVISF